MPICVIFDLDGTLVDSELICQQALVDLLPELGCTALSLLERYRGMQLDRILTDITAWSGLVVPADFVPRYREHLMQLLGEQLEAMPGAADMLRSIEHPMCIASGGPPAKIARSLGVAGLDAHFGDRVFSSYDVGSWKPEPGLFLHAARCMGFPPESCVVIEDSPPGLEAARRAGMRAFHFAPDGRPGSATEAMRLENLADLPQALISLESDTALR